jgi:hypothetical protein
METSYEIASDRRHAGDRFGRAGRGSECEGPGRESPLAAGAGAIQQAQNQDCAGKWKRADVSNKGVLEGKELDKFRSVLNTVDTNKDGKISQSEFMTACQKGELKNIQL